LNAEEEDNVSEPWPGKEKKYGQSKSDSQENCVNRFPEMKKYLLMQGVTYPKEGQRYKY